MAKVLERHGLATAGLDRGVLATNVFVHERTPDGAIAEGLGTWYGPSHPENGPVPAAVAETLPERVWDVRANWPTPMDAAAVGLDWNAA